MPGTPPRCERSWWRPPISCRQPIRRAAPALHQACAVKSSGQTLDDPYGIETGTTLLEAGTNLEAAVPISEDEGDFRATPLWYAVARGENLALVRFLLQRGADASFLPWAAIWRDDVALCPVLLDNKLRLNLKAHGETPIFYAARLQRPSALTLLIDAGADPTIVDDPDRGRF
jgi:hypothetical protein